MAAPIPVRTLGGGQIAALVDEADLERLARFRWRLRSGYVVRRQRHGTVRRYYYLHREVVGATHGDRLRVGHVNGDRLDNRRANLAVGTGSLPATRVPDPDIEARQVEMGGNAPLTRATVEP